ncbi:TetR/AcrR family transcriptional regulator [Actinomadura sp. 9N407]|uniref:TetR/AcrR family transcriptional regulator n=1 Tax=Actinomadura sp. 9N407 TaxID=3375154 RepID=UPI0037A7F7E9
MDPEPRSAKGRRTRARLVEAGKTVFERDGFLQARITDIATEAQVSHGSFYHYFDSKESLFREIAEEVEVRLVSMDDIAQDLAESAGPVDRIRAANKAYLTAYRKEARIMRVIEEVSRYDDDVRKVRSKRDDNLAVRLESAIKRLQSEGLADERIDERYAATALGGMVAKFAEMMFIGGARFDMNAAVEQLTLLWANALGMDSTADRKAPAKSGTA